MAKKSKTRGSTSGKSARRRQPKQAARPRWRQNMLLGGAILVLVVGIGVFVRYWQQSRIPPQLQGAIDNHYARGVAGAPVVVKEFSDFT